MIKKNQQYYCAGGYVVCKNKLLLINNKTHGFIGIPKGHIESDETKIQTARREIAEETGYYDLELIKELDPEKYVYQLSNEIPIQKTVFQFLFKLKNNKQENLKLDCGENIKPIWVNLDEADKIATHDATKETIRKIRLDMERKC